MAKTIEDEQEEWIEDLEASLLLNDAKTVADVVRIFKGKPISGTLRALAWQKCLETDSSGPPLTEIFDLPEQNSLRQDCQQFVEKLGNEDEDKVSVMSDLETLLTTYRKATNVSYESGNGWLELLLPLLSLKRPQCETYALFSALRRQYIPNKCTHKNGESFHLLRLLLLYHDPQLCSFLDTKRITPDLYCRSWSLFAANCQLLVVLSMWDLYFQQADTFFLFFLSLVIMINARDQILALEKSNKEVIAEMLTNMPSGLELDDVSDFWALAQYYALKTPSSFRKDLQGIIFEVGSKTKDENGCTSEPAHAANLCEEMQPGISQALCLPVCASELIESISSSISGSTFSNQEGGDVVENVRFFLVDCRPAEQYNAGHLPTAFHLDCNLMLQEPAAFATAVQGLLSAQRQALAVGSAAAGNHLCFLGSGRNEEDQYTHMVVASFLQKHTLYVSMLTRGYQGVHDYLGDTINESLEHHNHSSCLVCKLKESSSPESPQSQSQSADIFSKLSAAVSKLKTSEVKGKFLDYIVNPTGSSPKQPIERHVRASDKLGRRYRNVAPVFSIDDDQEFDSSNISTQEEETAQDELKQEVVNITQWTKEQSICATFPCQEVKVNNTLYDSLLAFNEECLFVLRLLPGLKGQARVVAIRPLSSVIKITSRRKHPNLITFKYGVSQDNEIVPSDMDRLLIPNANTAMKAVTKQIVSHLRNDEPS